MKRSALLIGNGIYTDTRLAGLRSPKLDVETFANTLLCHGFDEAAVLLDEADPVIRQAVEDIASDRTPSDLILIYLSCHGVIDAKGRLHFASSNTRTDRLASTALAAAFLNDQLQSSSAGARILVLDCCFSGAFAPGFNVKSAGDPVRGNLGTGYIVLTASSEFEFAFEPSKQQLSQARCSVFTEALIEGLTTGAADHDGDGWVSPHDLFRYAGPIVTESTSQRPNYFSAQGADQVLLCRVGPSTAAVSDLVPVARASSYVPRMAYQQAIRSALLDNARIVALVGEPGNGKTQLARAMAGQLRHGADDLMWFNAHSTSTLFRDVVAELARREQCEWADAEAAQQELCRLLAAPGPPTLVVFDNVEDWQQIFDLLPSRISASVLATSRRDPGTDDDVTVIRVRPMQPEEAADLVGQLLPGASTEEAKALSQALGGWPLAVAQVCGLLASGGMSVRELLETLDEHAASLLDGEQERTLTGIHRQTLDKLTNEQPTAVQLLRIASLLSPSAIPLTLLREALAECEDNAPTGAARLVWFSRTLSELSRRCIIDVERDVIHIHPLSHGILRGIFAESAPPILLPLLAVLTRHLTAEQRHEMLTPTGLGLLPHMQSVLRLVSPDLLVDDVPARVESAATAVAVLVRGLIQIGDPAHAVHLMQDLGVLTDICQMRERLPAYLLPAVVACGDALRFIDRSDAAIVNFQSVLRCDGLPRSLRLAGLIGLGAALKMQQRYREAGLCFDEALELIRDEQSPEPLRLGQCLFGLANVQFGTSRWAEAETSYRQALDSFKPVLDSPAGLRGSIDCLKGMTDIALKQNRIEDAKQLIERATQLREASGWFRDLHTDSKLAQARGDVARLAMMKAALSGEPDRTIMDVCLQEYRTSFDLYRSMGATLGQAISLYRLACVHALVDTTQAMEGLREAAETFELAHNRLGVLKCQLLDVKLRAVDGVYDEGDVSSLTGLAGRFRDDCGSRYWCADAILTAAAIAGLLHRKDLVPAELLDSGRAVMLELGRPDKVAAAHAVATSTMPLVALISE